MAVAALVIYSHVAAQDSGACSVTEGGSSARISACSKLIENGNLKGDQLADALFARGAAYDDDHQYGQAIKDYTEVIRLHPASVLAYNARGAAYDDNKQLDLALADYNEAIRLTPDSTLAAYAWANRALVEVRHGLLKQALSDYDEALNKDSQNGWALYGRGIARRRAGGKAGGDADLAAANKLDPGIAQSYAGIGIRP